MKIVIIGGGPCGIGAAYHLNKVGHTNWNLFEKNSHVGGLSASFKDDAGFTWDIGGHVLFSHYAYFDKVIAEALGDAFYEHQRESWIRILETWVPYPFQNNVRYLPDEVLRECVEGLRTLCDIAGTKNFRDWMDNVFGVGIVKYFMKPYNQKVWGVPLETMSKEWIAERVSVVDLARIERNVAGKLDDLSWGPNSTFKFPQKGGTGSIYKVISQNFLDKISFNHEMLSVDMQHKQVTFTNGHVETYDALINTSPLDLFAKTYASVPDFVKLAADDLIHNSGLIIGAGFQGMRKDSKCWMYFPESDCPFYRVTNFHNYSPHNVPLSDTSSFFSLMCETTYSSWKPVDKANIVESTLLGLEAAGLLGEKERDLLASTYAIDIPYSYPVPTLGRDKALGIIQPYFESMGIYSRGRFGAWKYEVGNMDHSFMQGVEVVDRILQGKQELTLNGLAG